MGSPQHLKDLLTGAIDDSFLNALIGLNNLPLTENMPKEVSDIIF